MHTGWQRRCVSARQRLLSCLPAGGEKGKGKKMALGPVGRKMPSADEKRSRADLKK